MSESNQQPSEIFDTRRTSLPYAAPADYHPPFPTDVVGTYSNHGIEPQRNGAAVKMNQDRAGVEYPFLNNNLAAFAVFDGHGVDGALCSDLAMNIFMDEMAGQLQEGGFARAAFDLGELEHVFEPVFENTHRSLCDDVIADTRSSGTTATVIMLGCAEPSWVAVANAGDSPCVCGRCVDDRWSAVTLTEDHKPSKPFEMARIARAGGIIKKLPGNEHAHAWLPNYSGGLAMSRSLGDSDFHEIGISTTPHLSCLQLTDDDRFLIIASDGLSEFISADEMVYLVSQYENATDACTELVHEAMKRWSVNEGAYRDDITCTIVMLQGALNYMRQSGAGKTRANVSSAKSLVEVAPDERAFSISGRASFTRRRSVICARHEDMEAVSTARRAETVNAKRDPMPAHVLKKRRSSLNLSPDMDSGLDQVEVHPPGLG